MAPKERKKQTSKWNEASQEKKRQLLDSQNFRRALKAEGKETGDEYDKLHARKKKEWQKRFNETKTFDFAKTEKVMKEADITRTLKGYRWKTRQQIQIAEGYTTTNKDKAALKNANALILRAQNNPKMHKVY